MVHVCSCIVGLYHLYSKSIAILLIVISHCTVKNMELLTMKYMNTENVNMNFGKMNTGNMEFEVMNMNSV